MSGLKTIRRRITSVKNTKQITRAMKLVSAAKLKRAQDAALAARRYSNELNLALRSVLENLPADVESPLISVRKEVKKTLVIVIAGERGLCGAYNTNVIKAVQAAQAEARNALVLLPLGKQAMSAAKRFAWATYDLGATLSSAIATDEISSWPIDLLVQKLTEDFTAGEFDAVKVIYTRFVSTMTQLVSNERVLPFDLSELEQAEVENNSTAAKAQAKFDPEPLVLLPALLRFALGEKIRQAALESKASEHAARMTAMDSATRNADELISQLRLFYNRARQTAITRELIDIVGGAEAIK